MTVCTSFRLAIASELDRLRRSGLILDHGPIISGEVPGYPGTVDTRTATRRAWRLHFSIHGSRARAWVRFQDGAMAPVADCLFRR